MATTAKICTLGARHKWLWIKDVTLKNVRFRATGTEIKLSRRGVFHCECGAKKYGVAQSGL